MLDKCIVCIHSSCPFDTDPCLSCIYGGRYGYLCLEAYLKDKWAYFKPKGFKDFFEPAEY